MFTRILVGVDGRPGGRDALALARRLAAPSAHLTAVHVAHDARDGSPVDAAAYEALLDAELADAGISAEKLVIGDRYPGRGLRLATARTGADLLVLGSSHRGRPGHAFAGDTARTALHGSHCAVAVAVRSVVAESRAFDSIGVGFDGSHEAREALGIARELACAAGSSLRLIAVGEPSDHLLACAPDGHPWASLPEQRQASTDAMVAATVRVAASAGVNARAEVVAGFPADGLERLSQRVDLLVIGSRGYGPARRTLLGSTADRLLHTAHCPVLVVPRGAMADERPGYGTAAMADALPQTALSGPACRLPARAN